MRAAGGGRGRGGGQRRKGVRAVAPWRAGGQAAAAGSSCTPAGPAGWTWGARGVLPTAHHGVPPQAMPLPLPGSLNAWPPGTHLLQKDGSAIGPRLSSRGEAEADADSARLATWQVWVGGWGVREGQARWSTAGGRAGRSMHQMHRAVPLQPTTTATAARAPCREQPVPCARRSRCCRTRSVRCGSWPAGLVQHGCCRLGSAPPPSPPPGAPGPHLDKVLWALAHVADAALGIDPVEAEAAREGHLAAAVQLHVPEGGGRGGGRNKRPRRHAARQCGGGGWSGRRRTMCLGVGKPPLHRERL